MRLDKYLKVSRLIKRRTVANEVADAGRILINGKVAKASQAVNAGDIIEVTFGNRPIKVRVLSDVEPRTKDVAREMYEVIAEYPPRLPAYNAGRGGLPMEKAAAKPPLPHDLILESRSRLTVTGVQRVLHCSAESAALETGKGILHLSGAQISMQTLDLEAGEAKLTGRFDGLEYTAARTAGSFWHRLLR